LIERHIDFIEADKNGATRSVALDPTFVRHYMKWRDSKLPVVSGIVTTPLVLPDGMLLATQGLDRQRGLIFRLQPELLALLPDPEDCTDTAVAKALQFLTNEWLVDVACDYAGKCVLIASALTIIERFVLAERPAFFVTAGQRGGGKTTTLQMVFVAATGYRAPAAAWSSSEEERRKCLFSYLGEGVPAVVWDNIPRGAAISCPSIEKSLTAALYSDRVLGQTGTRTVPATTIIFFTGNNIGPRGDMASRSLQTRLTADRPDPENRSFTHADPVAWTFNHRGNIVRALYTILLGNPRLQDHTPTPAETRFKGWWHLVGSAVEHAAELNKKPVRFRDLFLSGEADEEHSSSLSTVLDVLRKHWTESFTASDVATFAGQALGEAIEFKAALEAASGKPLAVLTATTVAWRLKALADAPVLVGGDLVALRYSPGKTGSFIIKKLSR
jgi:hypothetical protein